MFVEERVYTLKSGQSRAFVREYEDHARAIQEECLGKTLGIYNTQFGAANQIVMLWKFETLEDRTQRFQKLLARKDWQNHLARGLTMLDRMENKLLAPLPFFAERLGAGSIPLG
jgi:hypothetical protein